MNFRHNQITDLFTFTKRIMSQGLWYSGIEDEGLFKKWNDNGQINVHCFYKNDKLEGEYKAWNPKGKLVDSKNYKDGVEI